MMIIKCKFCGEEFHHLRLLEHGVTKHNDSECAELLESLNKYGRGT